MIIVVSMVQIVSALLAVYTYFEVQSSLRGNSDCRAPQVIVCNFVNRNLERNEEVQRVTLHLME